MTIDTRPAHLYFNRNLPKICLSDEVKEQHKNLEKNIHYCNSWSELSEKMQLHPTAVCFHISELEHSSAIEIVNMVDTLAKLTGIKSIITVTVGIEIDTEYSSVKALQKSNVFGIVPSGHSFPIEETYKALSAQWNNIPYWPKHILEKLPGAPKNNVTNKNNQIVLTPRQKQIIDLITERGSSNKIIAKTLKITESTVKLHVGAVLKKFGLKNRTQLAVFVKKNKITQSI